MNNESIKEVLLNLLEELCDDDIVREDMDINLLEENLIDSIDYIELFVDIEDELGIVLVPSEFAREEMDTPRKIIEQVTKKING